MKCFIFSSIEKKKKIIGESLEDVIAIVGHNKFSKPTQILNTNN